MRSLRPARVAIGALMFGILGAPCGRALEWEATTVFLEAPAGSAEIQGEFRFTNRGSTTVRIRDVGSSCGCTVPSLEKEVFAPGESGRIRAVYHVDADEGLRSETITVTTDEPLPGPYTLTLEVAVEIPIRITPRLLYWRVGDDPAPKALRLVVDEGWTVSGVESGSDRFSVEMIVAGDGAILARVTPVDTWARREGKVAVRVARGDGEPIEYVAFVRVL